MAAGSADRAGALHGEAIIIGGVQISRFGTKVFRNLWRDGLTAKPPRRSK